MSDERDIARAVQPIVERGNALLKRWVKHGPADMTPMYRPGDKCLTCGGNLVAYGKPKIWGCEKPECVTAKMKHDLAILGRRYRNMEMRHG